MDELELEWDPNKARQLARRGLTFEEAGTVFMDRFALTVSDVEHSTDEDRYATIGTTDRGRLLVISTPRSRRTRLITAWPAAPAERREYEQNKAGRSRHR